jgi:hypothetical protein
MQNAPPDQREKAIMEKARVVMEAKKQLDAKYQHMAMREANINQREADLQAREAYVAQQAQDLQSREAALAGQAPAGAGIDADSLAAFEAKQRELDGKEAALSAREAAVKDEEGKLETYRSELIGSAQTLVQKEEEISKKDRELAARSIPIDGRTRELELREQSFRAKEEELKHLDEHMKDRAMELQKLSADLARWKKELEALANSKADVERRQAEQAERERALSAKDKQILERDLSLRTWEKKLNDGERSLEARRADADRALQQGQTELSRRGDELVALQKQYKERVAALHAEVEKLTSIPHPAMTESMAVRDLTTRLEQERARTKDLDARLNEETRRFTELKRDYDAHRQRVAVMEQSLSKAERDLADYERREGARVKELEDSRNDLMQKARMLMEQEEELRRQEAMLRAAPAPGAAPDDAAKLALDRRAAMLDQQAAAIKRMGGEQEAQAARLRDAAAAVAAKERAVEEREEALRQAAAYQAPPSYQMMPAQEAPPSMPEPPAKPGAASGPGESDLRQELARAEAFMEECRLAGGDVSAVADQLRMSRGLLDERKYDDAAQAVRQAVAMAQSCRDEAGARQRSEALESAQKVVAEVKQLGVQVAEAEALLEKAVEALRSAQTDIADRLAREAQEKAQSQGAGYNRASELMQKLDADYREVQAKKPDVDYRDVTTPWTEASAAWDRGDYATAAELSRKAMAKLEEFRKEQAEKKAQAPGPPAQKYRCPSCANVFQVVPPAFRPFDVGCPHCHTVVRISK